MCFLLFFKKKYYLERICKGEISIEEVANIYSTTPEIVEKAEKE